MTIDEAISKYRNRVEQYKDWENMKDIAEEYEQLAEWLENYKRINKFNDGYYKAGYTKAIDDFAKALKKRYPIMENDLFTVNDVLQKEIDKLAEQLKEGSADNE